MPVAPFNSTQGPTHPTGAVTMPIPRKTRPEVCDKPADDNAYALMIGCIQNGFSFLGPFKAEDEALQAWTSTYPAAIVPHLTPPVPCPGTRPAAQNQRR